MGVFEDLFVPYEVKNRRKIDQLQSEVADFSSEAAADMENTRSELERLRLICRALTELVVAKGLATSTELSVLMQQIDLEDGVEDGRLGSEIRQHAPRCGQCNRFINPQRDTCVYCGASTASPNSPGPKPPQRTAQCASCNAIVPESSTWFTASGLACNACYENAHD